MTERVLSFEKYRDEFYQEFEEYYAAYPLPAPEAEHMPVDTDVGKKAAKTQPCEEKSRIYRAAVKCPVHVFRYFPFYYEVCTGRARNGLTAGFPPEPGIGGTMMRNHSAIEKRFFDFRDYYKERNLFISFFFTDFAHHCIGYEKVLRLGLNGLSDQAEKKRKNTQDAGQVSFLDSVICGCAALKRIAENFAREAAEMAGREKDGEVRGNLLRIARTAARVPAEAPETFYEALNTIWFMREIVMGLEGIGIAVIGHFDRLLYPYYEKDVREGRLTRQEAKDLLSFALNLTDAKWDLRTDPPEGGANTAMTIGGCDQEGRPVYNEVSRMILEIFEEQELVNPKLQARISRNHPAEFFERLARIAGRGKNVLSIFNDEVLIPAQVRQGKELQDSRLYVAGGCQEPVLSETEVNCRAYIYMSLPKLLLLTLGVGEEGFWEHEGLEPVQADSCRDFEEFYACFLGKARQIVHRVTGYFNEWEREWYGYNPCPLYSATITGCIEKGLDMTQGGAKYNTSSFSPVGFGTLVDSLFAVQKAVYEQKFLTLHELRGCLNRNFEGSERTRAYLANRVDKWGRDSGEINRLASRLADDLTLVFSGMPNTRGGWFENSLFTNTGYVSLRGTEATPDGRRRGEILSRGIGPGEATGHTNLSRILEGLGALNLENHPASAVLYLDLPYSPNQMEPRIYEAVIRSFLDAGGSVFDFNLTDAEVLLEAQRNPEQYANLVVRVWGFSAYFTALDRELQDEMIARNRSH